jgi:hypothetical protein
MNLASHVRHFLTFLAGLGTILLGWNLLAPEQVAEVNAAGGKLIEPLMVILGAVGVFVARMALAWISKIFRSGSGELDNHKGGSGGGLPCLLLLCGMAGLMGFCLPSCAAVSGMPIKASLKLKEGRLSYSSKGGIEMQYRPGYGRMPAVYAASAK